jgi:predicted ATPase
VLHQLGRDGPRARVCAEACGAIAAEHGFSFWRAGALVMGGWALAKCGEAAEGVQRLRRGLEAWAATGSVTYRTYYLGLLAEALGGQGQAGDALRVLEEALALVAQTGEGLYEAELLRLRGELRRGRGEPGAEEDFGRALAVARGQGARSLELRAALSLARLLREQGRGAEARPLLAGVYAGFTEGQDTPDLREAQALLGATA